MNRILEGYMLLLEKDNYGSVYGHKVVFRSFIELKGIDKWEFKRKEVKKE